MKFGQKLKSARLAAGLSQKDLAEAAGIERLTVSQLETGRHMPQWETLRRVCHSLSLPLTFFQDCFSFESKKALATGETEHERSET